MKMSFYNDTAASIKIHMCRLTYQFPQYFFPTLTQTATSENMPFAGSSKSLQMRSEELWAPSPKQ